jgi:hypothetical protein
MSEEASVIKWRDRKHWMWFPWSFTKYEVRNDRLYIQRGFFKTEFDETLLYRIVDLRLTRTFAQKIFGTGTITIFTRVDVNKEIYLTNIKNPVDVKDYLSDLVETARNSKKVVGKEFYGGLGGPHGVDLDGDGIPDELEFEGNDADMHGHL